MITDKLANSYLYYTCHPEFRAAFEFLLNTDLLHAPVGKYDIQGDDAFALVQQIETRPADECMFESHREYIDIQYILADDETIGYSQIEKLTPVNEYEEPKDARLYTGTGDMVTLGAGEFAVFFPQDGHMPGVSPAGEYGVSKKVVLKVRCR